MKQLWANIFGLDPQIWSVKIICENIEGLNVT